MKYVRVLSALGIVAALLFPLVAVTPAMAASITVTPAKGPPGTVVTVIGQGFNAGEIIEIDLPPYESKAYITVNPAGTFSTSFPVPNKPPGSYMVQAWRLTTAQGLLMAQTEFVITPTSEITISPVKGKVGAQVEISGQGYNSVENISVRYDGATINIASGDFRTDNNGKFKSTAIMIPKSSAGYHTITVSGQDSSLRASADFLVEPAITISPSSGPAGTRVTVTGNGFGARKPVSIFFSNVKLLAETAGTDGSFTSVLTVPQMPSGAHDLKAEDDSNSRDTLRFTILPGITISPTSGNIGGTVTVTGSGFRGNSNIAVSYDTVKVADATTGSNGVFSATFKVPTSTRGQHTVSVSDGTDTASATFNALTSASLNLTFGYVGADVAISGTGFGGPVTITYDGKQVATTTTDTAGAFSAIFKVPVSKGGQHEIVASAGESSVKMTFTVESNPPPVPSPTAPLTDTKTPDEAKFTWLPVSDPSQPVTYVLQVATSRDFTAPTMVLEKKGLTSPEYTLTRDEKLKPANRETPYYWRVKAFDAASNEGDWSQAQWFYTRTAFVFPEWTIPVLVGLFVVLVGVVAYMWGRRTARRAAQ